MNTNDTSRQPDRAAPSEAPCPNTPGLRKLEVTIDADLLDFAEDQSFPASDPPAITSIRPIPETRETRPLAPRDPSKRDG